MHRKEKKNQPKPSQFLAGGGKKGMSLSVSVYIFPVRTKEGTCKLLNLELKHKEKQVPVPQKKRSKVTAKGH